MNDENIFILCEYNISINLIERLYVNNITLEKIIKDSSILRTVLKESKSNEIENAVNNIDDINRNSVYQLYLYGLSKRLIDELYKMGVTLEQLVEFDAHDINEKLGFNVGMTNRILSAVKDYIKANNIKIKPDFSQQIKEVIKSTRKDKITFKELSMLDEIRKLQISNEEFQSAIEKLKDEGFIIINENNIEIKYLNLEEAIENKICNESRKEVIKLVLSGLKQIEVANMLNLSRERIRQIYGRAFNALPKRLDEDAKYQEIFQRYEWTSEIFNEIFNENPMVFNYLKEKYQIGVDSLENILGTDILDSEQENIIKKHLKLIEYNGTLIKEDKIKLMVAILKTSGRQYFITDLVDEYNKTVKEYKFNLEIIDNVRAVESILSRQKNIIMSSKRRFRYYNYDLLTQEDLNEIYDMIDVDEGTYYSDYFFNNNLELMKRINILDENELFNLLKKVNKRSDITFGVMPNILIGYENREKFILEKINLLAPISVDDFCKILEKDYGYKFDSFKGYVLKEFSVYITKNIIDVEQKIFSDYEKDILKKTLVEEVYSIKELKEILKEILKKDCTEYIKSFNFEPLGYKIREKYIVKISEKSIDDTMKSYINKNDVFDYNNSKLKNIGSSFSVSFYDLTTNNKIIKYEEGLYLTEKGLENKNITYSMINEFKNKIWKYSQTHEIFTLSNLKTEQILDLNSNLYVSDIFLESIIKTIDGIKCLSIEKNIVFIRTDDNVFTKNEFIEKIIIDNDLNKVKYIQQFLSDKYNIELGLSEIKELIDSKKYEMEDIQKKTIFFVEEKEDISNSDYDYNFIMCMKFLEKVFGLGIQQNFDDSKVIEFLKRFDNSLNTFDKKYKTVVILKNGLKNGKTMTAEEVSSKLEIITPNRVSSIDRLVIEKMKDEKRTGILRKYLKFSDNKLDEDTSNFILDLLK